MYTNKNSANIAQPQILRRNPPWNWVILIFIGQKSCTRIIKNILHSFCTFFKTFNTKENETPRKWMSNFTKLHLSHEIFRGLPAFSQFLWNLTFISSDCHEKFSLVSLPMTKSPSLGLKKCTKECNILLILVQGFCSLRIKITQFPGGFRLKVWVPLFWSPDSVLLSNWMRFSFQNWRKQCHRMKILYFILYNFL